MTPEPVKVARKIGALQTEQFGQLGKNIEGSRCGRQRRSSGECVALLALIPKLR